MTKTAAPQAFTAEAQAILDDIQDRWYASRSSANVRPNAFGGFDMHQPMGGAIRTARDDTDWIVYVFDSGMRLQGSHRLSGTFSRLSFVASVVADLL